MAAPQQFTVQIPSQQQQQQPQQQQPVYAYIQQPPQTTAPNGGDNLFYLAKRLFTIQFKQVFLSYLYRIVFTSSIKTALIVKC